MDSNVLEDSAHLSRRKDVAMAAKNLIGISHRNWGCFENHGLFLLDEMLSKHCIQLFRNIKHS